MLMETLCNKDDLELEGYSIRAPEKREDKSRGIMFAIRNEFANQAQLKSHNTDIAETLFMQMICGKEIATLGLVYAPQENQTSAEELDMMYKYIEEEINRARTDNHIIILGGDFNSKIGDAIDGNKKEVSKGGRRLLKMAKGNSMKILNTTDKYNR